MKLMQLKTRLLIDCGNLKHIQRPLVAASFVLQLVTSPLARAPSKASMRVLATRVIAGEVNDIPRTLIVPACLSPSGPSILWGKHNAIINTFA
jgi:hypothetical protein